MNAQYTVQGAQGVRLHVREFGNPEGIPLLLVHGWSQSHLCWSKQYSGDLAQEFRIIAPDLRGHGQSEKPVGDAYYTRSMDWAEDLHAVIRACALKRPVLAGWSYGGLVCAMYLRHFGDAEIAGINFVGAACRISPEEIGRLIGNVFLEVLPKVTGEDLGENIAGMRTFLQHCFAVRLAPEDWDMALGWNVAVPGHVRGSLLAAPQDTTDALARLSRPALVTHGTADAIVLPAMARLLLERCPSATASWYEGIGHGPFLEAPARFNTELASFARAAHGASTAPNR